MSKYADIEKILNDKGRATRFPDTSDLYYHESILQNAPAEDVAPVIHAHWEHDYWADIERCSFCERWVDSSFEYPYCPYCGAKMDEKEEK